MNVIRTNGAAFRAQNAMRQSTLQLRIAAERLSSGKRINSARGDAAGLAIATAMTSSIRGMNQAIRNAHDGVALAQTAEGALGEVVNMLQRIRELAIQSASGTYTDGDRGALQMEVAELAAQANQVIANTKFNDLTLFGSANVTVAIHTGARANDTVDITVEGFDISAATATDVSTQSGATAALDVIDDAIGALANARAVLGGGQSRLESVVNALSVNVMNLSDSRSRIEDADVPAESTALAKAQILNQASTAMLAQANQSPAGVLSLIR